MKSSSFRTTPAIPSLCSAATTSSSPTEHTARENWIGGFKKDGENVTKLGGPKAYLGRMLGELQAVPFVIRETRCKFE